MIGIVFTWNGRKKHIKDSLLGKTAVTLYLLYLLSVNMKGNMMEHWWSIDKERGGSLAITRNYQGNVCTKLGLNIIQGIDGSAAKPALRQDTGYMVEKTYLDIAPYLGAFGAYVMPQ